METEYIDLVSKIIAAEHTAQEIAREAQEKQQSLAADLERDIAHMREDYFARAKHRIEAVEKAERKGAEEDIAKLDKRLKDAMDKVERAYQQNKDQWVDTLFFRIVGGRS